MSKVQLAILPAGESRSVERRVVNLLAQLRPLGAWFTDAVIRNISSNGFSAEVADASLQPGSIGWVKLTGSMPRSFRVIWTKNGKAGFQFSEPMEPGDLARAVVANRRPRAKGHFGRAGIRT